MKKNNTYRSTPKIEDAPSFGFITWDISTGAITICPYLAKTLAFKTKDKTQSHAAYVELTHPDDISKFENAIKAIKQKKSQYIVIETRKLCRDGTWHWFDCHAEVVSFDPDGNPLLVTGMCADITHAKENEEKHDLLDLFISEINNIQNKSNQELFDSILSFFVKQVPAPVAIFDTNMCYKFASDAWLKLYKYKYEEKDIVGKSYYEVWPNMPKEWREKHARGLAGETLTCEAELVSGLLDQPIWVEWIIHPWYTLSKSIGGIIIYSNIITDRVESQNKLKAAVDDLTRSNQALDQFAYVCSHDLKEPLRGISSFINLLHKHNSEHFDEESLSYIRHILKGIDRMNTLIKDFLSYSESICHASHVKTRFDAKDVLREVKEIFLCQLADINAQLNIGDLPIITGNKTQIEQVFTNLIGNAIKFRSKTPLVIDIFAIERSDFWEFHVRDNGIGIAPEDGEIIFDMLKRLHSKTEYEGSGIGLATCRKIINEHHGKIYVQQVSEGGSDFIFTLPKIVV